jgi:hypothetical protein
MCQYTDEGAANALMWLYGYDKYIGPMVWTSLGECVKYVLDSYHTPIPVTLHPNYPDTYFRIPVNYAYPYVEDASVCPLKKEDLFAFHAIKDTNEFLLGIQYIEELY